MIVCEYWFCMRTSECFSTIFLLLHEKNLSHRKGKSISVGQSTTLYSSYFSYFEHCWYRNVFSIASVDKSLEKLLDNAKYFLYWTFMHLLLLLLVCLISLSSLVYTRAARKLLLPSSGDGGKVSIYLRKLIYFCPYMTSKLTGLHIGKSEYSNGSLLQVLFSRLRKKISCRSLSQC